MAVRIGTAHIAVAPWSTIQSHTFEFDVASSAWVPNPKNSRDSRQRRRVAVDRAFRPFDHDCDYIRLRHQEPHEVSPSNARVDASSSPRRLAIGHGVGRRPGQSGSRVDESQTADGLAAGGRTAQGRAPVEQVEVERAPVEQVELQRIEVERAAEGRALRLLSETAHDLRSPLTTIREAVRLVRDGSVGSLNDEQRSFLASVIDQCDCVDQLVGELVQLDRLRTGLPRVQRCWVAVRDIRHAVDETLRPWAMPRQISILWDAGDDPTLTVFADASILRRLIVNLVSNAIRVTAEGAAVLIRLQRVRGGEAIRWDVIDQGVGIAPDRLREISRRHPDVTGRQVSMADGEGIGLAISRQLAALHFSGLQIRSRVGTGTEVSFETPACGPRSVAECWTRWRRSFLPLRHQPVRSLGLGGESVLARLDPPSMTVELRHDNSQPQMRDRLIVGAVSLGATVPKSAADHFDLVLQNQQRLHDLVYRTETRHWVWLFDTDLRQIEERISMITDVAKIKHEGIRLHWSRPHVIPVDDRSMGHRILDWFVRHTLAASVVSAGEPNEVRLGTQPVRHSAIAEARLDQEIRRLERGHGRLAERGHGRLAERGHGRLGERGHGRLGERGHGRLGERGHGRLGERSAAPQSLSTLDR